VGRAVNHLNWQCGRIEACKATKVYRDRRPPFTVGAARKAAHAAYAAERVVTTLLAKLVIAQRVFSSDKPEVRAGHKCE
jgi:hypothetical protein